MGRRHEVYRRIVQENGSTLAGHSMNQKVMGRVHDGEKAFFGLTPGKARRSHQREIDRNERKRALGLSISRLMDGSDSIEDVLSVVVFLPEFETDGVDLKTSVLDLRDISPSKDMNLYGEPSQSFWKSKNK